MNIDEELKKITDSEKCQFNYEELKTIYNKEHLSKIKGLYPTLNEEEAGQRALISLIRSLQKKGKSNKVPWLIIPIIQSEKYDSTEFIKDNPEKVTMHGDYACFNSSCSRLKKVVKEQQCGKCQAPNKPLSPEIPIDHREKAPTYGCILEGEDWTKHVVVAGIPLSIFTGDLNSFRLYSGYLRDSNVDIVFPPISVVPASIKPSNEGMLNFAIQPFTPQQADGVNINPEAVLKILSPKLEEYYLQAVTKGDVNNIVNNAIKMGELERVYEGDGNKTPAGYTHALVAVKANITDPIDTIKKDVNTGEERRIFGVELFDNKDINSPRMIGWYSKELHPVITSIGLDYNEVIAIGNISRSNKVYDYEQGKNVKGKGDFMMTLRAVKILERGTRLDTSPPTLQQLSPLIKDEGSVKVFPGGESSGGQQQVEQKLVPPPIAPSSTTTLPSQKPGEVKKEEKSDVKKLAEKNYEDWLV